MQAAISAFGTVHILINNAGILRDKSFKKMSQQELELVLLVHLKGAYECTKACWPVFRKQKVSVRCTAKSGCRRKLLTLPISAQYGRILNTASAAGLYGNMGQANYSAAKSEQPSLRRTAFAHRT